MGTKETKRQRELAMSIAANRKRGGRPKSGKAIGLPHRARPFHDRHQPVHITWRLVRGLPSMRGRALARVIGYTIRKITESHARRRTSFRVLHVSIQPNHLHLIVEAGSEQTLSRGLQGLGIWIARRVNGVLEADGRLLADRYHARELTTPRAVRICIVYVLQNHKHHEPSAMRVDECSSARWFDGWKEQLVAPDTPSPVAMPVTWLAAVGWRKWGLIGFNEAPAH